VLKGALTAPFDAYILANNLFDNPSFVGNFPWMFPPTNFQGFSQGCSNPPDVNDSIRTVGPSYLFFNPSYLPCIWDVGSNTVSRGWQSLARKGFWERQRRDFALLLMEHSIQARVATGVTVSLPGILGRPKLAVVARQCFRGQKYHGYWYLFSLW
jgi:hypothetical protein